MILYSEKDMNYTIGCRIVKPGFSIFWLEAADLKLIQNYSFITLCTKLGNS